MKDKWSDHTAATISNFPTVLIKHASKKTDQAHPPIHPTKYTDNLQVIRSNYISEEC
jgi:DNA topoisomerase IA